MVVPPAERVPNVTLTRIREAMNMSLDEFAKAVQEAGAKLGEANECGKDLVYRWESGAVRSCRSNYRRALEAVTGKPYAELGFHSNAHGTPANANEYQPIDLIMSDDMTRTIEVLSSLAESPMERRTFVLSSGAALIIPAHRWLLDPDRGERLVGALNGRPVTNSTASTIEQIINDQRRVADSIPIDAALPSLQGSLATVVQLLKNSSYTEDVGARLYTASSELTRMIGWLHYENGTLDAARAQLAIAFQAARTARNRTLCAYTLQLSAILETMSGDPRHAIVLLQTAQTGARGSVTHGQRALTHASLALAYGALHDAKATRREAEDATSAIAEASGEQAPPYLHWVDAADLAATSGQAFLMAGAPQPAQHYLERAVGQFDGTVPRERAGYTVHLAETLLAQGEVEHACATATQAVETAETIGSSRLAMKLGTFVNSLAPYRRDPAAAALMERTRGLTSA